MTEEKSNKQRRSWMYVQQLSHLTISPDAIKQKLAELSDAGTLKKYALIIHDKDETESHIHVYLYFKNGRTLSGVADIFNETNVNRLRFWDNREYNAYSYLLHLTDSAKEGKHIYSANEVTANFDFPAEIEKINKKAEKVKKRIENIENKYAIEILLGEFKNGRMTRKEIEDAIGGGKYGRVAKEIREIDCYLKEKRRLEYKEGLQNGTIKRRILWFWGPAGCGKTFSAQELARKQGKSCFVSGSRRDPLQGYDSEEICVLDEIREKSFKYDELLKILDPFNSTGSPSRYQDKFVCGDIIITSYMSPRQYFDKLMGFSDFPEEQARQAELSRGDSFLQLARRIFLVQEFNEEFIKTQVFNQETLRFEEVEELRRPNPYYRGIKFAEPSEVKAFLEDVEEGTDD